MRHENTCLSIANKVAMIYGEVNFTTVKAFLAGPDGTRTQIPDGIILPRFIAMVVQAYRGRVETPLQS